MKIPFKWAKGKSLTCCGDKFHYRNNHYIIIIISFLPGLFHSGASNLDCEVKFSLNRIFYKTTKWFIKNTNGLGTTVPKT